MKKIKDLKLTNLAKKELEEKEMKALKGGDDFCGDKCGKVKPVKASAAAFWEGEFA